ncbi:MAG: hypothetical protein PHS06_02825 [Candidatus Shapirobacteria bacterium]|nr:hypothetical protein [Candidatus Shapirobacteria bacterium]
MGIVEKIFNDCLLQVNEGFNSCIRAEGIVTMAIFNSNQLEKHRTEIEMMLNELSNFEIKIEDHKWDEQLEKLLQLGIGLNIVKTPIYQKEKVELLSNETIFYSIAS